MFELPNSFNRYIVECKLLQKAGSESMTARFNRYIVECKLSYFCNCWKSLSVLIDT